MQDCIAQLEERFPASPRVQILQGMKWEATGELEKVLKMYDAILEVEDANAVSPGSLYGTSTTLG